VRTIEHEGQDTHQVRDKHEGKNRTDQGCELLAALADCRPRKVRDRGDTLFDESLLAGRVSSVQCAGSNNRDARDDQKHDPGDSGIIE
jgi:hypothetical protein